LILKQETFLTQQLSFTLQLSGSFTILQWAKITQKQELVALSNVVRD